MVSYSSCSVVKVTQQNSGFQAYKITGYMYTTSNREFITVLSVVPVYLSAWCFCNNSDEGKIIYPQSKSQFLPSDA